MPILGASFAVQDKLSLLQNLAPPICLFNHNVSYGNTPDCVILPRNIQCSFSNIYEFDLLLQVNVV